MMSNFPLFETPSGGTVYINLDHVTHVKNNPGHHLEVHFTNGKWAQIKVEDLDKLLKLLQR